MPTVLYPPSSPGEMMGILSRIYDWIMGYDFVSVDDAVRLCTDVIRACDINGNGMLNARECVRALKKSFKALSDFSD